MPNQVRILVGEDNPTDAYLLKRAILRAGISVPVDFVRDGQEIIDYVQGVGAFETQRGRALPALLLLDLKMPRLDGFDVLKWLRAQHQLQRVVIVVLTSSGQTEDIRKAYDLGANSFVVKPAEFPDLQKFAETLRDYWLAANSFGDRPLCEPIGSGG